MPSKNKLGSHKPWRAIVKRSGVQYSLGHYATYEEAFDIEAEFKAEYPPQSKVWSDYARERSAQVRREQALARQRAVDAN